MVEDEHYSLEPGDSLLFASRLQHRWRNAGKSVTQALIVLSGFETDERPSEYHLQSGQRGEAEGDGPAQQL